MGKLPACAYLQNVMLHFKTTKQKNMRKIERVLFIGSKQLGLDCLKSMYNQSRETLIGVMTFDDTAEGRNKFNDFNDFCSTNEIPIFIAKNRTDSEKIIENQHPDICIVVGWYWLISNEALNSVPYGLLGIHNSLLPKYRGGSPLIWSIINGEKNIGFSMFTFTEGMDEGDIWFQYEFELNQEADINSVLEKIEKEAVKQLDQNYKKILSGELKPKPQNHQEATYCAQRKPDDGRIDWNKSASQIYNFIRAQSYPYPGAFTTYKNKKLIIWKAIINKSTYYGTAGQVARISNEGVTVICGDNKSITIKDVEYDGKKIEPNRLIKTINTRFDHSQLLIYEINEYLEIPEIKKKIVEYIDEYDNHQKRQMFLNVRLPDNE